ncbi:MAG: NAD(P)/FAD-dependent oxidoreductase [Halothiobacillus sp.]
MTSPTALPIQNSLKIAVIGSGIAGIATAWLLGERHEVTLFEKNSYLGGHTHTHTLADAAQTVAVDTGFIVFNRPNYPHLTGLLAHLDIPTQPTEMSFGVSLDQGRMEYGGSDLSTLFAQKSNLLRPRFLTMVQDILRFNRAGKAMLIEAKKCATRAESAESLGDFLDRLKLGAGLREDYLLPMAAAIWSCPPQIMLKFPALSFLQFFENHGLMNVQDRPQWETIQGGSNRYVEALRQANRFTAVTDSPIAQVIRGDGGVFLPQINQHFDACVFASHADETLAMLAEPDARENEILGAFQFQENTVYLHNDLDLMPKRRKVWSSWNYLGRTKTAQTRAVAVTYWMNHLQNLSTSTPWLVTLNPFSPPRAELTRQRITYHHPVFDAHTHAAQAALPSLQGHRQCYYAGAWTGFGFHEDGLRSAVNVAAKFGITPPWEPPA